MSRRPRRSGERYGELAPTWRTIPNGLTLLRLLLAVPLVLGIVHHQRATAFLILAAGAMDALDGILARRLKQISRLGGLLDPVVDKIFMNAVMLALVIEHRVAVWIFAVILGRDLAVSLMRLAALRRGRLITASWIAKRKMDAQLCAAFVAIGAQNPKALSVELVLWFAVSLSVLSGANYLLRYVRTDSSTSTAMRRASRTDRTAALVSH
jgi:CDP-diacylglycerol--glycerol-3-phosphate 3-phosphatidyltransferase